MSSESSKSSTSSSESSVQPEPQDDPQVSAAQTVLDAEPDRSAASQSRFFSSSFGSFARFAALFPFRLSRKDLYSSDSASSTVGRDGLLQPFKQSHLYSGVNLSLTMTLLTLLLSAPRYIPAVMSVIAIAGLVSHHLRHNGLFWIVVVGVFGYGLYTEPWANLDNHIWLEMYWLSVLALAFLAARSYAFIALSARLLLGFAFLFATLWKILASGFPSGGFFEVTFATDSRLGSVLESFGLVTSGVTAQNASIVSSWRVPGSELLPGVLDVAPVIFVIAPFLAAATIILEGMVAVSFLAPLKGKWQYMRDISVAMFVLATYPLAPVLGFGRLILALAVACSALPYMKREFVYASLFIFVSLLTFRSTWLSMLPF